MGGEISGELKEELTLLFSRLSLTNILSVKDCERDQVRLNELGAEGATPPETLRQKDRKANDILESRFDFWVVLFGIHFLNLTHGEKGVLVYLIGLVDYLPSFLVVSHVR